MTKNTDIYNVTHTGIPVIQEQIYTDSFYEALSKSAQQYKEKTFTPDSIVQSVINKFHSRAEMGYQKYNNTLDRNDFTVTEWITNSQEELMDAILYLEKLKKTLGG